MITTTAEYLLNKYGPLLTRENVVEIFRYKNEASFNTAVSAGRVKIEKTGVNDLFHYADVAAAIDALVASPQGVLVLSGYSASRTSNPSAHQCGKAKKRKT